MDEFQKWGDLRLMLDVRNLESHFTLSHSVEVLSVVHTAAVRSLATSVAGLSDVIEKKAEKSWQQNQEAICENSTGRREILTQSAIHRIKVGWTWLGLFWDIGKGMSVKKIISEKEWDTRVWENKLKATRGEKMANISRERKVVPVPAELYESVYQATLFLGRQQRALIILQNSY
jgi:intracellular sulfur oxidation DsrE/DsrF family protein